MIVDILVLLVVLLGFGLVFWYLQKRDTANTQDDAKIEAVVNKVFGMSVGKIAEQSKQVLESEKNVIKNDLEHKQKVLEQMVDRLHKDIEERQKEIRDVERDRTKKFSEMSTALEEHRKLTDQLKVSTEQLSKVLSNNQQRGEWGERIIEDLLQANGLVEGVHYVRQKQLANSSYRPDITLLLPNQRNVPVDVKFPYSEIQKMSEAETKSAKAGHLKQFGQDLKVKINKVAEYIDPSHNTLDYAIMFVPNEMVFSFINQQFPNLIDLALSKRVIVVSPFTFLIVARTVMESYRNFMIGDRLKEVIQHVDEFVSEWDKFKGKFEKYGRSLDTLRRDYEDLTGTRFRQMDRKVEKVQSYQSGSLIGEGQQARLDMGDE